MPSPPAPMRTAAMRCLRAILVVERDRGGVVLDDRGARVERGLHHLLGRERAAEHRGRLIEPLVLVLRALDGAEHLLGLHDAQHLAAGIGEQIAIGLGERRRRDRRRGCRAGGAPSRIGTATSATPARPLS